MHLSIDALLSVRDGTADPEAREHVVRCPDCAGELARLAALRAGLSALAEEAPSRDLFPAVVERLEGEAFRRRWRRVGWAVAGFAVVVTLAAGVRGGLEARREMEMGRTARALQTRSEQLEQQLRGVRAGAVVRGRTAQRVMEMEDRLALIDAQLAQHARAGRPAAETVELWQQRVELLDALVDAHTTRLAYVGL